MADFILDKATKIKYSGNSRPVRTVIDILKRDIDKVCTTCVSDGTITLRNTDETDCVFKAEAFRITVDAENVCVDAGDDLGFEYALLYISRYFLGVLPFWFWMDREPENIGTVKIPTGIYVSGEYRVRYRGWFFNDEVLMMGWPYNKTSDKKGWRMAFEALLRCGGNMAIPGTDRLSRENAELAAGEYGLWLTHHHAEPLGAEMFARAYPGLEAVYFKHPDKFEKLWEEAVLAQKDYKVVWNLCFRGQGDRPFWSEDKTGAYDTDEKRGKAISDIIKKQAEIVCRHVKEPVFCTNLYGEIMELYEAGYITFPENVILVRADNGYGKMVTRRRGNHDTRISSMPDPKEKSAQGIYYHVSFYDLQAAAQLSMLPNSVSFVADELEKVIVNKGNCFWVINCSNVRPHVYFLDAVSKIWCADCTEKLSNDTQSEEFAKDYFDGDMNIAELYREYADITPKYGEYEDMHAGEQFYTDNLRYFVNGIITGKTAGIKALNWYTGDTTLKEQLDKFVSDCETGLDKRRLFYERICDMRDVKQLITLKLQAMMHLYGSEAVIHFGKAYEHYRDNDYKSAFYEFGRCAELIESVDRAMKGESKGIWEGYYDNDCQADFKFTAYEIRKLMGICREYGDGAEYYKWQHEYIYAPEDRDVALILLNENHATDDEIYTNMCKKMKNTEK